MTPGTNLAYLSGMAQPTLVPAIILGRTAAACVHPFAAWRLLSMSWRVLMLIAYVAASYAVVLSTLLALSPA